MEQILNKLSEIETTARRIMEDADRTKAALSSEMEQQCRDFDAALEQKTNLKIQELRNSLEKQKDQELTLLHPHHLFPNLLSHLYGLSPCRRRCEIYPVCLGHQHHSCAYRLYLSVGAGTALGSDRCVDGRPHRSELPIDLGLYPFPAREVGGFENLTKTSFFH